MGQRTHSATALHPEKADLISSLQTVHVQQLGNVNLDEVHETCTVADAIVRQGTVGRGLSGGAMTVLEISDKWDEYHRPVCCPLLGQ